MSVQVMKRSAPRQLGGSGGVEGGRALDIENDFEVMLEHLFGAEVRADADVGLELWSALTNVVWHHSSGDKALLSYRRAGDVIAAIRRNGDYLDWYCSSPSGRVSERVARLLAGEGWTFVDPR